MKIAVVFYSMYGHTYKMAEAVAKGAREIEGAEVQLVQVPELCSEEVLREAGAIETRATGARSHGQGSGLVRQRVRLLEASAGYRGAPRLLSNASSGHRLAR